MTESDLITLDTDVQVNHQDPSDVASTYVKDNNLGSTPSAANKESITVGSAAFSENEMLADIYVDVLKSAGFSVTSKRNLGSREIYEPALESGQIDLIPEYVGNSLSFLDTTVGSLPLPQTVSQLQGLLTPKGLIALDPSNATDSDAIVVTQATATNYNLVSIADLGNPA